MSRTVHIPARIGYREMVAASRTDQRAPAGSGTAVWAVVTDLDYRRPSRRLPKTLTGRTVIQRTSTYVTWGFPNDQHVTRLRRQYERAARRSARRLTGQAQRITHTARRAGIPAEDVHALDDIDIPPTRHRGSAKWDAW